MKISYFDDYESMSDYAASLFLGVLKDKKDLVACAATGGSPLGLYERLAEKYTVAPTFFDSLKILKLDEWGGIPMDTPQSCHAYLHKNVLKPLKINLDRYIAFNSETNNPLEECTRIQNEIDKISPVDVCILGLGKNGHLGFNEPADFLQKDCHVAQLSALTLQHSMVQNTSEKPTFGMTVGMKSILQSQKIILLITGQGKGDTVQKLLTGEINTQLPASLLWLHDDVECLIDKNSCEKV